MARKGGLGRGFDSLIPTDVLDETFDPTAENDEKVSELRHLKLSDITPAEDQPRKEFEPEALRELSVSIEEHGILQPIVVTPIKNGYEIVAGERRWRAAQMAGLEKIPALVRTLNAQHKLELALIENLQRKDLNPLETATAYLKLHTQFNMPYDLIAQRAGGKATSTISNVLRLLQLPDNAKEALVGGVISEGHARQILALPHREAQDELLSYIVNEAWSVRKAEQYVIGYRSNMNKQEKDESLKKAVRSTLSETPLTQALSKRLRMPVTIKTMAHGGRLIISYKSDEELEKIQKLLG